MSKVFAGRYMIVSHIGQGGMADVYVAMDTLLNREVAIKVLRGELSSDPVALLRFQREAQASCSLIHPNIVEIYDVGEENGHHYIVMEYIRGKTLKQLIHIRGALIKEEAVAIMKQLVSATIEAHNKGIIHRDIKPQNVLVKTDGTIKMVDFGIALAHDALQLTQNDSVMGSVHYLAPELARGESASNQSDIYSLGIVFYELLTGDVPFKADQPVQVALKHMRDEMPSIKSIVYDCPQSIENILIKACAKRKEYRYANCEEMLRDLLTCLNPERLNEKKLVLDYIENEGDGTIVMDPLKKTTKKKPVKKSKKKNIKTAGYIVILAVIGVVSVVAVLFLNILTNGLGKNNKMVTVPECVNETVESCAVLLEELNLSINTNHIEYKLTDSTSEGKIISMSPEAGESLEKGSKINLVVSSGTYLVMDDYIDMNIKDAQKLIQEKYTNVRVLITYEENDADPGTIIAQELLEPQATFSPSKSNDIRFIVSKYNEIVIPHNLIGMDINEAYSYLTSMGVDVLIEKMEAPQVGEGQLDSTIYNVVVKTSPSTGSVYTQKEDNNITLYYY